MNEVRKGAGLAVSLLVLMLLGCGAARAGDASDLYRGRTIVTGQGEETRGPGLAQCLVDVLIKVSGDPRLADDRRVAVLAGKAGTLVSEIRYHDRMAGIPVHDEQGTRDRPYDLFARFDKAKIDAALRSLGREPWIAPRPRLAVLVAVRTGSTAYYLTSDGDRGRDQRDALKAAATRLGLPMALPEEAGLVEAGMGQPAAVEHTSLDTIARAMGGDLALVGDLVWSDAALGWVADWRLEVDGQSFRWRIAGVSFDKAFLSAMRGAAQILSGNGRPS